MIKTFHAKNYACLKDVTIELTPLHAFVGPNDSGKSTILRGIRSVVQFACGRFQSVANGQWDPFHPQLHALGAQRKGGASVPEPLLACGVERGWYGIKDTTTGTIELLGDAESPVGAPPYRKQGNRAWNNKSHFSNDADELSKGILESFSGARLLRFDPDAMRRSSPLLSEPLEFSDDRGGGLPGVYQAILGRGDEASENIRDAVRKLFPGIKRIGVKTSSVGGQRELTLEGELIDGSKFDVSAMSEGLLYFLAFSLIPYLEPVSVLLIEEPENGLHPARIQEVMRSLRAFVASTGTQVLMATHSPLVINELEPEEVSVVTKGSIEEGTKVTRIKDTPNFEKRSSVYALGELWLAYADGHLEAPLLQGGAR